MYRYLNHVVICLAFLVLFPTSSFAQDKTIQIIIAAEMRDILDRDQSRYAELKYLIDSERSQFPTTFFLFGGGSVGPSAMSNLDRGSHIIDLLNSLEPDAMGVSKREFSYNVDELSLRSYEAAFPIVSSNIIDKRIDAVPDGLVDKALITRNKVKLGFISVIDERLISEYLVNDIIVKDIQASVESVANNLRKMGANIIILHYFETHPAIAHLLDKKVVDYAIISNTRLRGANKDRLAQNKRIFMLDKPNQAIVAKLSTETNYPIISVQKRDLSIMPVDTTVENQVNAYLLRLNRLLDDNIAFWAGNYTTRREDIRVKENAFANFVVDAMREYGDTDIALINAGSFNGDRVYTKNTQITRKTIATEFSFRSTYCVILVTGKQLLDAIEAGYSGLDYVTGGFPHVSGMRIEYDSSSPPGNRVKSVVINGEELDQNKKYRLATIGYLASGGDGYDSLALAERETKTVSEQTILISDIVLRKLVANGKINSRLEKRIIDKVNDP